MYSQIFDHKGPVLFLINYLAVLLGEHGLFLVEYAFILLFILYIHKTARLWISSNIPSMLTIALTIVVLSSFYEGGNLSEEYALPFIMMALYIFAKYFKRHSFTRLDLLFLGASFVAVLLLRANMIAVWLVFILGVSLKLMIEKKYSEFGKCVLYFSLGSLTLLSPIAFYLQLTNSLIDGIYQTFIYNFSYLDTSAASLFDVVTAQLSRTETVLVFVAMGVFAFTRKIKLYESLVLLASLLTCISIFLSRRPYAHYLMVIVPLFALSVLLIFRDYDKYVSKGTAWKAVWVLVLILLPFTGGVLQNWVSINASSNPSLLNSEVIQQNIARRDYSKTSLDEVANYIKTNTAYEDRIYSHRISGNPYLESERLANTKYFNLPAESLNDNNQITDDFFREMQENKAKLILVYKSFDEGEQTGFDQRVKDYIHGNYEKTFENAEYVIYQ